MRTIRLSRPDATFPLALLVLLAATCALLGAGIPAEARPALASAPDADEELVVVFIGRSTCGASRVTGLAERMRSLRDTAERRAREQGRRAVFVGVATDPVLADGLAFLEAFGRFDEVIVGRGWLNHGLLRYVREDHPGPASIPQVVVYTRTVTPAGTRMELGPETLLLRKVGVPAIRAWAEAGFPLSGG